MTDPTEADYALVDKHTSPEDYGTRYEDAVCAVAELRTEMQAKLDAERKLADALACGIEDAIDTIAMHGLPRGEDRGAFMLLDRAECDQWHTRATDALAAHAAARKEG